MDVSDLLDTLYDWLGLKTSTCRKKQSNFAIVLWLTYLPHEACLWVHDAYLCGNLRLCVCYHSHAQMYAVACVDW